MLNQDEGRHEFQRMRGLGPALGVLALALTMRWGALAQAVAAGVSEGYDASVYYVAGAALLDGRVPYTVDFIFLHPPLVMLATLPFAALGALTSAHVGYVTACAAFGALGALAAAGTTRIAQDWGARTPAAVAGGVLVASWSTAVSAQSVIRLEPFGDALLVTLLLVLGAAREPSRRRLIVAGAVVALLVNVKIWWFLPVAVLVLLLGLRTRGWRAPTTMLLGAVPTALLLDLPFLIASRGRMFFSIVTVQGDRPAVQGTPVGEFERLSLIFRLGEITGVSRLAQQFATPAEVFTNEGVKAVTVLVCLIAAATAALALRSRLGRLAVPLLAVHLAVLAIAPLYFPFYGDLVAVPAGLVLAAAASVLATSAPPAVPVLVAAGWVVFGVLPLALGLAQGGTVLRGGEPVVDRARLLNAVPAKGCVVADTPRVLVALDLVDRSLADGCRNVVDVQGIAHGAGPNPRARVSGGANRAWRVSIMRYLNSAETTVSGDRNLRANLRKRWLDRVYTGRTLTEDGEIVVAVRQ